MTARQFTARDLLTRVTLPDSIITDAVSSRPPARASIAFLRYTYAITAVTAALLGASLWTGRHEAAALALAIPLPAAAIALAPRASFERMPARRIFAITAATWIGLSVAVHCGIPEYQHLTGLDYVLATAGAAIVTTRRRAITLAVLGIAGLAGGTILYHLAVEGHALLWSAHESFEHFAGPGIAGLVAAVFMAQTLNRARQTATDLATVSDRLNKALVRRERINSALTSATHAERAAATEVINESLQTLSASWLWLQGARRAVSTRNGERAIDLTGRAIEGLKASSVAARSLMDRIRPSALEVSGLASAIRTETRRLENAIGTPIELHLTDVPMKDALARQLLRIAQDAIGALAACGGNMRLRVSLATTPDGCAVLRAERICDGACQARVGDGGRPRLQLDAIGERTRAAGGEISISNLPGDGFIEVTVPLGENAGGGVRPCAPADMSKPVPGHRSLPPMATGIATAAGVASALVLMGTLTASSVLALLAAAGIAAAVLGSSRRNMPAVPVSLGTTAVAGVGAVLVSGVHGLAATPPIATVFILVQVAGLLARVEQNKHDQDGLRREAERAERESAELLDRSTIKAEEERTQIADLLHDEILQGFAAILLRADAALMRIRGGDFPRAGELLTRLTALDGQIASQALSLERATEEVPSLSHEIRPVAPAAAATELGKIVANVAADSDLDMVAAIADFDLGDREARVLSFAAREALSNVLEHSGADLVGVRLTADGDLAKLEVVDNGRGWNGSSQTGISLLTAELEAAGGSVKISQRPGGGTKVTAALPRRQQAPAG